jgi:sugar phosphate isomerase/epimerase
MPDPTAAPFRFFVPILREHAGYLPWIVSNRVGVEIQDLIRTPGAADDPGEVEECISFWQEALAGRPLSVSFHGPCTADLVAAGRLKEAMQRSTRAMEIAAAIGARDFIVHPRLGAGGEGKVAEVLTAWTALAAEAGRLDLNLLFENTDEDDPRLLGRLVDSLGPVPVALCFDLGHARRCSTRGIDAWLEAFGSRLQYVHLYDSTGDEAHRALGDGDLGLDAFLARLTETGRRTILCLEMDVPQILASVPWLTARGLFRLKSTQALDLF